MDVDSNEDNKENHDQDGSLIASQPRPYQEADMMNFSMADEDDIASCSQFSVHAQDEEEEEDENRKSSSAAECGTIEKVILQNFMCHKYFEVELGSRVNFVIGRNGSKYMRLTVSRFQLILSYPLSPFQRWQKCNLGWYCHRFGW